MNLYGTLTEVEYSPYAAFAEPLSLGTVKDWLELPEESPPSTAQDAKLELLISAAREEAERLNNSDVLAKGWVLTCDYWPGCEFRLRAPLLLVNLFRYRDRAGDWHTLTEGTDFEIDVRKRPGIVYLKPDGSWPSTSLWPSGAIEIYFTSGILDEADIPRQLKLGMLWLISHWFTNRLAIEIGPSAPRELPYTIAAALEKGAVERFG